MNMQVEYPRAGDKHSESNEEDQSIDSRTLKAARWADFEEDSIWHERVGLALLEAGYEVKAIEEFEKAKVQDQANWRADIGLAKALSKSSEKRLQAIDMMEKTLQVLEQNTNWMSDNERLYQKFCLDLAGFYIANADGEKAAGMYPGLAIVSGYYYH
jgi:predicted O-linked N-acetylglucosamine transferase (SPINDLY family)